MSTNLPYLLLEHPEYQDEIRLLNLYNQDFQKMAVEYHALIDQLQALDKEKEKEKLRSYQNRQKTLKHKIQSMLVKHALAATL